MAIHLWSVLASEASVDQRTNKLSIFGVLEELTVPIGEDVKLPTLMPLNHTVISLWQKELGKEESFELTIRILGPTGTKLGDIRQPVKIPPQHRRARTIIQMEKFPLVGPGEYTFQVVSSLYGDGAEDIHVGLPLDVIIPKGEA